MVSSMSRDAAAVEAPPDMTTHRICTYLRACGIEDPERQGNLCQWVRNQVEDRASHPENSTGDVPFRALLPFIDEALAVEAGFPPPSSGQGCKGCQPRLLRGKRRIHPAFGRSSTWQGPPPTPVKMHPQDLSAFPSLHRIGLLFPNPATSWSWVTVGGLAFLIVAFW